MDIWKMGMSGFVLLCVTICSIQTIILGDSIDDEENLDKRAPGWGKRDVSPNRLGYLETVLTDLSRYELNRANGNSYSDINKRRPGWGKRNMPEDFELDKRRPGWGKRAYPYDIEEMEAEKRAPGWGKRGFETSMTGDYVDEERQKRRPGWGKRSDFEEFEATKRRPGWGKRAPGWGKRSDNTIDCQSLINDIRLLRLKLSVMMEDLPEYCPSVMIGDDDGGISMK